MSKSLKQSIQFFTPRVGGLLLVIALFISLWWWSEPLPFSVKAQGTPTPDPVQLTAPLATPLPEEWLENRDQTNGIVFGSIILILIVLISTTSVIRTRNRLLKEEAARQAEEARALKPPEK